MKTIKVRIAVAVDREGHWTAAGWTSMQSFDDLLLDELEEGEARYWVTAELAVPEPHETEVAGEVEKA